MSENESRNMVVGWQAAAQAAERSVAWLRRRVEAGTIAAIKNEAGEWTFDVAVLEALRPAEPPPSTPASDTAATPAADVKPAVPVAVDGDGVSADTYAEVYQDLGEGKTLDQIVRDRRLLPDAVRKVAATWKKLREEDVNSPSVPLAIRQMQAVVRELVEQSGKHDKSIREFISSWQSWTKQIGDRIQELERQDRGLSANARTLRDQCLALDKRVHEFEEALAKSDGWAKEAIRVVTRELVNEVEDSAGRIVVRVGLAIRGEASAIRGAIRELDAAVHGGTASDLPIPPVNMSRLNVGDPAVRDAAPRILSQVGLECVDNLRVATPEEAAGLDAAVAGMVGGASQSSPKQPSSA